MKKSILSLILAVVFAFGAAESMVSEFASTEVNKNTSIAKVENNDYESHNFNKNANISNIYNGSTSKLDIVSNATQLTEAAGGSVKTYESESEYRNAQNTGIDTTATYAEYTHEEVQQIITVKTTATGSEEHGNYMESKPVSSAIIRLNGVPRYTDRNGQIKVSLIKGDFIELFVEKNDYNPYMEIMEVTGEEKVVHIKRPTDDMDIYGVNLTYDEQKVNLLNQKYSIDKTEEPFDETFIFEILCTVNMDSFILYQNEKVIFSSLDTNDEVSFYNNKVIWKGKNFSNLFNVGGNIKIEISYEGLTKSEELNLYFVEIKEIDLGGLLDSSNSDGLDIDLGDSLLGRLNFNFINNLKDSLHIKPDIKKLCQNKHKGTSSQIQFNFEIVHDNRARTTKIIIGASLEGKKTKNEKQEILNSFKRSYNACRNLQNYNVIDSLSKAFFCPGLTSKPCNFKSPGNKGMELSLSATFVGYVEISDEQFELNNLMYGLQDEYIESAGIEVTFKADVEWIKNCVAIVVSIPIPYYFKAGIGAEAGFNFAWQFAEGVDFFIEFVFKLYGKLGIGLGVGQVCGINIYGQLEGEFKIHLTDTQSYEFTITFIVGLEGKVFFFDFNIPLVEIEGIIAQNGAYKEATLAQLLSYKTLSINSMDDVELGNEPTIVHLDNKDIMVWVEDNATNDDLNDSKIYYSVRNGEVWSKKKPVSLDNYAECSPVLKCEGDKVYLTWIKSKTLYDENTTLGEVIESGELYISEFNELNDSFNNAIRLTNDNLFDAAPRFVKAQNGEQAVVWQKNTNNDILGVSGTNQLFISKLVNQKWSNPECFFETEKTIIDFEVGIENNELVYSLILDEDNDLETLDDRGLFVKKGNDSIQLISNATTSDMQMVWINDELQLLYLQENKVKSYKLVLSNETNEDNEILILNSITNSFKVDTFGDTYIISYLDPKSNGNTKLYVSILDTQSNLWGTPFMISNKHDIKEYSLIYKDSEFNYIYSEPKRNDEGQLLYCILGEDKYVMNFDIALDEVVLLDNIKIGNNKAYCFITNVGSYPIDLVKMHMLGFESTIVLSELLQPEQSTFIVFEYVVDNLNITFIDFSILLNKTESSMDNNTVRVNVAYSDVKMNVDELIFKNNNSLNLYLRNNKGISDNIRILVHKNNLKGDIVYTSDWITIEDEYELNLKLDYANMNINSGDKLCIELQCSNKQIEEQYYMFEARFDEKNSIYLSEEIYNCINLAKELMI